MTLKPESCACVTCANEIRCVQAVLPGGGDPTNLINWVNSYDITTIAWGWCFTGTFTDPSHTSPDYTETDPCTGGIGYPTNYTTCVGLQPPDYSECGTTPCDDVIVARSQFLLVVPTAYYVIAYGQNISAEDGDCGGPLWAALGCIYPQQADDQYPLIVDLPIPDNTLDETIEVQYYYLGIITGGAPVREVLTSNFSIEPDLASLNTTNSGFTGFGSNWSTSIATPCDPTPEDPFSGDDPP